jgi:hypothetical protein
LDKWIRKHAKHAEIRLLCVFSFLIRTVIPVCSIAIGYP